MKLKFVIFFLIVFAYWFLKPTLLVEHKYSVDNRSDIVDIHIVPRTNHTNKLVSGIEIGAPYFIWVYIQSNASSYEQRSSFKINNVSDFEDVIFSPAFSRTNDSRVAYRYDVQSLPKQNFSLTYKFGSHTIDININYSKKYKFISKTFFRLMSA